MNHKLVFKILNYVEQENEDQRSLENKKDINYREKEVKIYDIKYSYFL